MAEPDLEAMAACRRLITREDEEWWRRTAPQQRWTDAKTYRETAPHEYVVRNRGQLTAEEVLRSFHVIRTFGEPEAFHRAMNTAWFDDEREWRYFVGSGAIHTFGIVNRARTELTYAKRKVPVTRTAADTQWDGLATNWWTEFRNATEEEQRFLRKVLGRISKIGSVLDLGAGQGGLMDAGAVPEASVVAVDSSRAMLNHLAMEHPNVHQVLPMDFTDAELWKQAPTTVEVVTAVLGSASYLDEHVLEQAYRRASRGMVLMQYASTPAHADFPGWVEQPHFDAAAAANQLFGDSAQSLKVGSYVATIVRPR